MGIITFPERKQNKVLVASNTLQHEALDEILFTSLSGSYNSWLAYKFIPKNIGEIRITFELKTNSSATPVFMASAALSAGFFMSTSGGGHTVVGSRGEYSLDYRTPIGTVILQSIPYTRLTQNYSNMSYSPYEFTLIVKELLPVYLLLVNFTSSSAAPSIKNLRFYFDEIQV